MYMLLIFSLIQGLGNSWWVSCSQKIRGNTFSAGRVSSIVNWKEIGSNEWILLYFRFDEDIYRGWTEGVDETCAFNMKQHLMKREDNLIHVNFDPKVRDCFLHHFNLRRLTSFLRRLLEKIYVHMIIFQLVAVLREVKYIDIDATRELPGSATAIYAENETLRQFINSLDLTATWYNHVQKSVLHYEIALIEAPLKEIDDFLLQATDEISWDSPGKNLMTLFMHIKMNNW